MNFYYGLLNIKKSWLLNIFLVIIISISFFITTFLTSVDYENRMNLEQSNKLLDKTSFYIYYQYTPYDKISEVNYSQEEMQEEIKKITEGLDEASEKIKTTGIAKIGTLAPTTYYIEELEGNEKFYSESALLDIEEYDNFLYGFNLSILIDENVSEYMSYDVAEGRNFNKEDFSKKKKNNFSVIVGNNYKEFFSLGDKITAYKNDVEYTFDIVGILEKDTAVMSLVNTLTPVNGDYSMIVAYNYTNDEMGFPSDVYSQGHVVITDKVEEVEQIMRDEVYAKVDTVDEFGLTTVSGITEDIKWIHNEVISSFRILTVVFGIFTLIAIFLSIILRIKKDIYRLGVFSLTGARKKI